MEDPNWAAWLSIIKHSAACDPQTEMSVFQEITEKEGISLYQSKSFVSCCYRTLLGLEKSK